MEQQVFISSDLPLEVSFAIFLINTCLYMFLLVPRVSQIKEFQEFREFWEIGKLGILMFQ